MTSRKSVKKIIKKIIYDECSIAKNKIKGSASLQWDLGLADADFKAIQKSINRQYNLSLKRKGIKECDFVDDLVELVCYELESDNDFYEDIDYDDTKRMRDHVEREASYSNISGEKSKESFFDFLIDRGLNWLVNRLFDLTWREIKKALRL